MSRLGFDPKGLAQAVEAGRHPAPDTSSTVRVSFVAKNRMGGPSCSTSSISSHRNPPRVLSLKESQEFLQKAKVAPLTELATQIALWSKNNENLPDHAISSLCGVVCERGASPQTCLQILEDLPSTPSNETFQQLLRQKTSTDQQEAQDVAKHFVERSPRFIYSLPSLTLRSLIQSLDFDLTIELLRKWHAGRPANEALHLDLVQRAMIKGLRTLTAAVPAAPAAETVLNRMSFLDLGRLDYRNLPSIIVERIPEEKASEFLAAFASLGIPILEDEKKKILEHVKPTVALDIVGLFAKSRWWDPIPSLRSLAQKLDFNQTIELFQKWHSNSPLIQNTRVLPLDLVQATMIKGLRDSSAQTVLNQMSFLNLGCIAYEELPVNIAENIPPEAVSEVLKAFANTGISIAEPEQRKIFELVPPKVAFDVLELWCDKFWWDPNNVPLSSMKKAILGGVEEGRCFVDILAPMRSLTPSQIGNIFTGVAESLHTDKVSGFIENLATNEIQLDFADRNKLLRMVPSPNRSHAASMFMSSRIKEFPSAVKSLNFSQPAMEQPT